VTGRSGEFRQEGLTGATSEAEKAEEVAGLQAKLREQTLQRKKLEMEAVHFRKNLADSERANLQLVNENKALWQQVEQLQHDQPEVQQLQQELQACRDKILEQEQTIDNLNSLQEAVISLDAENSELKQELAAHCT